MPMHRTTLWERWIATDRRRKSHALDDPLDHADWHGLRWTIPLVSRLLKAGFRHRSARRDIRLGEGDAEKKRPAARTARRLDVLPAR